MESTLERTPTQKQLHAMRRKLCRMLDQCEPCGQPEYTECRKCVHGHRMRELMKEIEATQKRDRKERRTKKPVHVEDGMDALPAEGPKPARFSANYATFDEWLAHQKNPHSDYVQSMIALHEKYPDATRDELAGRLKEIQRQRQRERAAEANCDVHRFSVWHATFDDWLTRQKKPYSSRVRQMIAAHHENPTATKDELARMIEEKRTKRKRQREMKGEGQHGKIPS